MRLAHLTGLDLRGFDLNERAFSDARAVRRGLTPAAAAVDQFRPERKNPALNRLGRMDGTASFLQKRAVRRPRHTQAAQIAGPVNVLLFEARPRQTQESRGTRNIAFGEVHVTLLAAAGSAPGLAFEPQTFGHAAIIAGQAARSYSFIPENFTRARRGSIMHNLLPDSARNAGEKSATGPPVWYISCTIVSGR